MNVSYAEFCKVQTALHAVNRPTAGLIWSAFNKPHPKYGRYDIDRGILTGTPEQMQFARDYLSRDE